MTTRAARPDRLTICPRRCSGTEGTLGWPEGAPFPRIIVTAAPPEIPEALIDQLTGGRMVLPVGELDQEMVVVTKTEKGVTERRTLPVRFAPMVNRPWRHERRPAAEPTTSPFHVDWIESAFDGERQLDEHLSRWDERVDSPVAISSWPTPVSWGSLIWFW